MKTREKHSGKIFNSDIAGLGLLYAMGIFVTILMLRSAL